MARLDDWARQADESRPSPAKSPGTVISPCNLVGKTAPVWRIAAIRVFGDDLPLLSSCRKNLSDCLVLLAGLVDDPRPRNTHRAIVTDEVEAPPGTGMVASSAERSEATRSTPSAAGDGMTGDRPGYVPWPNVRVVVALLAVALVAFVGSFLVAGQTTDVIRTATVGPISTTSGQPQTVLLRHTHSKKTSYDLNLRFQFRIDVLRTAETIFHVGSVKTGLTASVSEPIDGYRYVDLNALNFSAVLVNHVVVGQTYAATVAIENGGSSITASVDGQRQFSYNYLASNILPALDSATIGGPLPLRAPPHHSTVRETALDGTVSGFTLASRELMSTGSEGITSALRVTAWVAIFAALILLALRIATGGSVAERLGISIRSKRQSPSWIRWVGKHVTSVGIFLLAAGIATLAIVTPLDNAVVQQSGSQYLATTDVGPNQKTTYALAGEPQLFQGAASLDVHLQFQMRLEGPVSRRSGLNPVVSVAKGDQGFRFQMHRTTSKPFLTSVIGSISTSSLALLYNFPLHQWVTISTDVRRSQSYVFMVDGQQVQSFTYDYPILSMTPAMLAVNGTFGGSVRNVTMVVNLFRQQPSRVPYLLIRFAQALGIAAIIASTILLAQRFLSNLIPPAVRLHRPLILTTFWTMGIGVAINTLVDVSRLQVTSTPYVERNTWLFTQYFRFSDFFQAFELMHSFNPYNVQRGSYPPIGYWLLAPVVWLNEYAALFVTLGLFLGFMIWWLSRSFTMGMSLFHRILIVAVALLSLPVSFAIDRGNDDLIVFVIVVLGIASFEQHRNALAALWIGLAGAAKILPILYLLLFLRGRKLRYVVLGVFFAGFATLLGFLGFGLGHSIYGFRSAFSALQVQNHSPVNSTYFNASIVGWVQSIGYAINGANGAQAIENALKPFVVPVDILGAVALASYLRWREGSIWRAVTLITGLFILLNEVSYYYELLFLFLPLSLFVKYAAVNRRGLIVGVLFGILLAPRAYFYLGSTRVDSSVLTTAPLLLALLVTVIYDGYRERASQAEENSFMVPDETLEVEAASPG